VDVTKSEWDCTIESTDKSLALRLGFNRVKHLSQAGALRLTDARAHQPFTDLEDLAHRARLDKGDLQALADADGLSTLIHSHRRQAAWAAGGIEKPSPVFPLPRIQEAVPMLRAPHAGESVCADYASTGLTLGPHPLALLRQQLKTLGVITSAEVGRLQHGYYIHTAGIVTTRQRPSSANNVTFVTLEDETGNINLVVWQRLAEQQHQALVGAQLLGVQGRVQREGQVIHVIAHHLKDYTAMLGRLTIRSRDFH